MSFEIEGKLHKVFETENKTASFQAREFVILISESNYPQFIKFQLTQDRCGIVDKYNEGDMVKVYFDLRGREWNDKYFTNLNAWRVEAVSPEAENAPFPIEDPASFSESNETMEDDFGDLPF
jgi:single-strand DNA-binding protein